MYKHEENEMYQALGFSSEEELEKTCTPYSEVMAKIITQSEAFTNIVEETLNLLGLEHTKENKAKMTTILKGFEVKMETDSKLKSLLELM